MAFYNNRRELVAEGTEELRTISECLGVIGHIASRLYPHEDTAALIRISEKLSAKIDLELPPISETKTNERALQPLAHRDLDEGSLATNLQIREISDGECQAIHVFNVDYSDFVVGALIAGSLCDPKDPEAIGMIVQAGLMLEQLGVEIPI